MASVFRISRFTLIAFPLASLEDFLCSIPEPKSVSRHLYTGHRMVNQQALSMLIPEHTLSPGFDVV